MKFSEEAFLETLDKTKEFLTSICDIASKRGLDALALAETAVGLCKTILTDYKLHLESENANEQ